jgi:hypothetical protein
MRCSCELERRWTVKFPTWSVIDAELDRIERDDISGLVSVFLAHRNQLLLVDGRKERVTVSSFSRHIGMPRHTFDSWLRTAMMETA